MFWVVLALSIVVWLAVIGVAIYAMRRNRDIASDHTGLWLILGGGVIIPTVVLSVLLVWSLGVMPTLREPSRPPALVVEISAERFWWRVRYRDANLVVDSANELRLPLGEPVEIILTSPDVIHSFWVPNLAGKMDAIPGRTTRLLLEPERVGRFRGQCAEFCGTSHAQMAFAVEVMPRAGFDRWIAAEARPAVPLAGAVLFETHGCGACHMIRGTAARGTAGPDLTHVGSRRTIAAAALPMREADLIRWIAHTEDVKPEVNMPSFAMLPRRDIEALATYLLALK
ncbi:cytochrome c oxidase subunit II [Polymorphobacter glacialis]|uniref:Cytochrome aa3 subunit 2 n=2 Tax=Sandarakinorhabdus glacialis TaxID=1614636 RepID=A0A917A1A8_9SPHN|nr:cytochrome c oxidase subunit II [Polymorphobacter glacialis]